MHNVPSMKEAEPIGTRNRPFTKCGHAPHTKDRKRGAHGLRWERMPSPASLFEESFEVLPTCSHQCLTVDTPEPSQTKAPHAMPVFGFSKERFNPDATLAHGFLVGWCLVVALHAFKIAGME